MIPIQYCECTADVLNIANHGCREKHHTGRVQSTGGGGVWYNSISGPYRWLLDCYTLYLHGTQRYNSSYKDASGAGMDWVVEYVFQDLLDWNNWFMDARTLSTGINKTASYESVMTS